MATIYIDNKSYEVDGTKNLLEVCLSLGLNLPYFCWHPALGSVGACRQCAVKQFRDEKDTRGRLVMSCMTPAAQGTRISVDDAEAKQFRESVIEWLMENHPHDCPVCDEGGACHLQDMTVMTGHAYREYRFKKRTHRNQHLGPFVNHEMNRCIACYRCVRYYRDYAGGTDLNVFGAHHYVYFGRDKDGVLESEFSGNLVEICPTGVFTDKTLKQHYTRKWDLQYGPSICVHCGLGCNTSPGERYGSLRVIVNRYNGQVNRYFLCDRGRFGYEFVNSPLRLRQPQARASDGSVTTLNRDGALAQVASLLAAGKAIGIGSPRASLEANFALRTLVGPDNFYEGMSANDSRLIRKGLGILRTGAVRSPSLDDIEQCDAVLVLGEDVSNTAPLMALALKQAARQQPFELARQIKLDLWNDAPVRELVQDRHSPFFVASVSETRLDYLATAGFRGAPDDIARLGFAVADLLGAGTAVGGLAENVQGLARQIADALRNAKRPVVVSGSSLGSEAIIDAAAAIAAALSRDGRLAELALTVPEVNSLGLAMMEAAPLADAFKAEAATVLVLENDLYRRADTASVDLLFAGGKHVIVIDHLQNATTAKAEVVLPAATFAEGEGTLVNNEGRAQRFFASFKAKDGIEESWRWLRDIMALTPRDRQPDWTILDGVMASLAEAIPALARARDAAPPAEFRIVHEKVPREPHRYSGRTSMLANITVHEPKPPADADSPLAFSMEGFSNHPPPALVPFFWAPGWNSIQSVNTYQNEVGGELRGGDPGVRLIEPQGLGQARTPASEGSIPARFEPRNNELLLVPLYHIFGSEELSLHSSGVKELAPEPYVGLNPEDAQRLRVEDETTVEITINERVLRLPARLMPSLDRGVAGLALVRGMYADVPALGTIAKAG
jgi:NADH-quinone oxidoreductase subunit G